MVVGSTPIPGCQPVSYGGRLATYFRGARPSSINALERWSVLRHCGFGGPAKDVVAGTPTQTTRQRFVWAIATFEKQKAMVPGFFIFIIRVIFSIDPDR